MTRYTYCAIGLLCIITAAAAHAQTPKPTIDLSTDMRDRFSRADLDGNGMLSKDEAKAAGFTTDQTFDKVDADHDGIVTLYEIGTYVIGRDRDWEAADTNGDGQISREEAERNPSIAGLFKQADKNGDGVVRKEEHEAFSETTLYQNVDLPYVVPNIINKKF